MSLEKLSRDDMIVGGAALLAVISLLFFPWFSFSANIAGVHVYSFTTSGTGSPDGWLGVLAMLCALAVVVDLAIERFSPGTAVPAINDSRTLTRFVLAVACAALVALKFLLHIHFNYFGWGFYFDVVVVGVLVYLTLKERAVTAPVPPVSAA
jgi:hypothetical protein